MPESMSPILTANLQAIQRRDDDLFERICLPVNSEHVQIGDDGAAEYRIHRTWHPFALDADATKQACADAPDQGDVLLFGLGRGELLRQLLKGRRSGRVIAWDRDPWMLRMLLTEHDLTKPLNQGRLWLRLGADLLDEVEHSPDRPAVVHPFFAERYANEHRLLSEGLTERRALVCDGTLFVAELADALRAEGFTVGTWEPARQAAEELARTVKRWEPEAVFAVNYVHGLCEACDDIGVKLAVWEIDPSTDALKPATGSTTHCRIFTWRESMITTWKRAGFGGVEYLPLAADPQRRQPIDLGADDTYRAPVAFVGASMIEQGQRFRQDLLGLYALWRGGAPDEAMEQGQAQLEAALEFAREDLSVDRTAEAVEHALGSFARFAREKGKDIVPLVAEMVAADKRLSYVAQIGQVDGTVWGDEGWRFLEEYGVRYMGPAGHRDELNRIYSGATINLDVGRIYQSDIVTMRVFDVMACGGLVLAERSDALEALFTRGLELDWYTTLQEMLERVEHWLDHPDEAAEVGKRGREAILASHSIGLRVRHMLDTLGVAPGDRGSPP